MCECACPPRQVYNERQMVLDPERYIKALNEEAHLAVRRESRKLMLVVTDGYPDSTQGVVELVGRLERANVECVGVGIQTDAPSKLFRSAVAIQSLEELSSTLFGVIGSRLI